MADSVPIQKVRDYIQKYNIEEKLSEAVNMAIKQESTDPFRVIAEYLKTLANVRRPRAHARVDRSEREGGDGALMRAEARAICLRPRCAVDSRSQEPDDEDEEDDDVMDEEEERRMMARRGGGGATGAAPKRHVAVAAAKFEVPADWSAPVFDKPEEAKMFLKDTMAANKLMKSLAPSDREQLMHAFKEVKFGKGDAIITQGDKGDKFYILDKGSADISITGKGSVMKATKGIAFGELALLHNAPRAATVTAEEDVSAWELDEISFKMILMGKSQTDSTEYKAMLMGVPVIQQALNKGALSEAQVTELAGVMREEEHPEGRNIITEGEEGHHFYIVRSGEVKCTKGTPANEVSKRLTKGDFFGELALLSSDKRAATVTATQTTSVLVITRAEFTRLLGSLTDILASSTSYGS